MRGPAIFLAQIAGKGPGLDRLDTMAEWVSGLGYVGVQIPTFDPSIFDLRIAADSQDYCDEVRGMLAGHGLEITELSTHRQGHQIAVHPAYDETVDAIAAPEVRGNPAARTAWAIEQLELAAKASKRLGLTRHVTFSGSLCWPYFYPYPPRPDGLVEASFDELARRWRPILDAFDAVGVDVCYEIHPGEDLFDGFTFEMFLERLDGHPRCKILYDPSHQLLQHMDYVGFIDRYHERIGCFHVKDAELERSARGGVYGGFQEWATRPARFRSTGDGDIDFTAIFSRLTAHGYDGWAVLEWECAYKRLEDGVREGAPFIREHLIEVTPGAFDAGMRRARDDARNRRILGLEPAAPGRGR